MVPQILKLQTRTEIKKLKMSCISLILLFFTLSFLDTVSEIRIRKKHLRVVVTRYLEPIKNISWLHNYTHTIYSRTDCEAAHGLHIVPLVENVGREGFVYLQHIIRNYHSLENCTVFLQGDIAIAYEDILKPVLDTLITGSNGTLTHDFQFLLPHCHSSYVFNWVYMQKLMQILHVESLRGNITISQEHEFDLEFKHLLFLLFDLKIDHEPMFTPSGSIAVSRGLIHRNPISYYIRLARYLGTENNPVIGHFYERSWSYLFKSNCSSVHQCNFFGLCR